ncbi:diphthamide biosynthesis protein 3 isoform X1 [Rissa tridactyla]|uniref:diphthamide biosynthesis protein 3 isoform X1 n=1 Tax=Rissa tridactyla TaxID=75485 RepID=UPI0023BA4599|nr:diphthamide biosynthesis protein 3 isoform X1 [Rissa tridactyla]
MSVFHDEVEIEDFEYDEETETYSYPCPCGDRFLITREDLENGEDVATCPSCSLILRVIYDQDDKEAESGTLPWAAWPRDIFLCGSSENPSSVSESKGNTGFCSTLKPN